MGERSLEALLDTFGIDAHHVLGPKASALDAARALRLQAEPGARVLLAQRARRSPWSRLKFLWDKSEADADVLEKLAGGLLLAGFETPRLAAETKRLIAVWAQVPSLPDPLDQVFLHGFSSEARNP